MQPNLEERIQLKTPIMKQTMVRLTGMQKRCMMKNFMNSKKAKTFYSIYYQIHAKTSDAAMKYTYK